MKLRDYRLINNLTPQAFALLVEASPRAVIKWERGERIPRPNAMAKIIKATDGAVQANDFFERGGDAA